MLSERAQQTKESITSVSNATRTLRTNLARREAKAAGQAAEAAAAAEAVILQQRRRRVQLVAEAGPVAMSEDD